MDNTEKYGAMAIAGAAKHAGNAEMAVLAHIIEELHKRDIAFLPLGHTIYIMAHSLDEFVNTDIPEAQKGGGTQRIRWG